MITLALSVPLVQAQVAYSLLRYLAVGGEEIIGLGGAALPVALANTGPFVLGRENSIATQYLATLDFRRLQLVT